MIFSFTGIEKSQKRLLFCLFCPGPVKATDGGSQGRRLSSQLLLTSYLPGLSVKTGLFRAGGVIRRFLPLMRLSALRAKSAIFLAGTEKSCFSRYGAGLSRLKDRGSYG